MAVSLFPYKVQALSPSAGIFAGMTGLSHTLGILFLRSTFAQPYPLSMARAKEERGKCLRIAS